MKHVDHIGSLLWIEILHPCMYLGIGRNTFPIILHKTKYINRLLLIKANVLQIKKDVNFLLIYTAPYDLLTFSYHGDTVQYILATSWSLSSNSEERYVLLVPVLHHCCRRHHDILPQAMWIAAPNTDADLEKNFHVITSGFINLNPLQGTVQEIISKMPTE